MQTATEARAERAVIDDATTPPAIGQHWPSQGGIYAGICRDWTGGPDYHLILGSAKPEGLITWQAALDWARSLESHGFADWSIPNRMESRVLYANAHDKFEPTWHWTSEQYSARYAWGQWFDDGSQYGGAKNNEGRARAVRRLILQPFNPS